MNTSITSFILSKYSVAIIFLGILAGITLATGKYLYLILILLVPFIIIALKKPFLIPFGLYVALIPLEPMLVMTGEKQGPTFLKVLGLLSGIVLLFKGVFEKKLERPASAALWWVLFLLYAVVSVFWAVDPELALGSFQTLISLLLLYLVVSSYKADKNDFEIVKWCVIAGGLVSSIWTIFDYIGNPGARTSMAGLHGINYVAFSCLIPTAVSTSMIFSENKIIKQALYWIITGIILFAIIVTGSRGCFLGALTAVLIIVILAKKTIQQKMIAVIMITLAGIVLISFSPEFFSERWGEAVESRGAGRLDIWYIGYKSLEKYWAFGAGWSNFPVVVEEFGHYVTYYQKVQEESHNIYLGLLVQLGVFGMTIVIIAIVKHYQAIRSNYAKYTFNIAMLKASFWGVLVASIFLHTYLTKSFWLLWIMIIMYKKVIESEASTQIKI